MKNPNLRGSSGSPTNLQDKFVSFKKKTLIAATTKALKPLKAFRGEKLACIIMLTVIVAQSYGELFL